MLPGGDGPAVLAGHRHLPGRRPRAATASAPRRRRPRPRGDGSRRPRRRRGRARRLRAATCCPACTTTGCSTPAPTLRRDCVDLCDLLARPGSRQATRRRAAGRPPADPLEPLGGDRLPRPDETAGRPRRPRGSGEHLPPLRGVLERELGVTPGHARGPRCAGSWTTSRACPGLEPGARPVAATPATLPTAALVGREHEFGVLRGAWRSAVGGQRRASCSCTATRAWARPGWSTSWRVPLSRQGAAVASSQCFGASGRLALAPVADWLRHPELAPPGRRSTPSGARRSSACCPRRRRDRRRRRPARDGRRVAAAPLLRGAGARLPACWPPALLVLDNLQWCDQETLAFLTFLLGLAADSAAARGPHAARRTVWTASPGSPAGSGGCGPRAWSPRSR